MACKISPAMKMKLSSLAVVTGTLLVSESVVGQTQTGAERLERGVNLQETDGDLNAAIKEYEAVLRLDEKSEKLAAEARFRLAECYQEKGNTKLVRKHVEALRSNFPAENRWVQKASKLLPVETKFSGTPWSGDRLYRYQVVRKNGKDFGSFVVTEKKIEEDGRSILESCWIRAAGNYTLSRSRFLEEEYRPLVGRWYFREFGDASAVFDEGGLVRIIDAETGKELDYYDHSKSGDPTPLYENEQMIQVIRTLNHKIGTKQDVLIISSISGAVAIDFDMEVTEHLDVETPVGVFPCVKIETNFKQTFYVSRDESRKLVKLDMGPANAVLSGEETWDGVTAQAMSAEHLGVSFELPGPMIAMKPVDNDEVYRVQVWSSDFAGRDALLEVNWTKNLLEEARGSSRAFAETILGNAEKDFDQFEVSEESWEEVDVAGTKGVAMSLTTQQGEITDHEFGVYAVGEEKAMSLRMSYAGPDAERARARALELVKSFRWE